MTEYKRGFYDFVSEALNINWDIEFVGGTGCLICMYMNAIFDQNIFLI